MILFELDGRFYVNGTEVTYQRFHELKRLEQSNDEHKAKLDKPIQSQFDPQAFATSFRPRNSKF